MILGISGSPRKNGITSHAVKYILDNCNHETKYISLSGKSITGCTSCLGCTSDNICKVKDDFEDIAKQLVEADAIVLGVPNYYDVPNALSHALLERSFCFRHQGSFLLKDKPVIILSTGYSLDEDNSRVLDIVENFAKKNKMNLLDRFLVGAYSQCYSCSQGKTCVDGNIVKDNGFVDEILPNMLPAKFERQFDSIMKCERASAQLNHLLV